MLGVDYERARRDHGRVPARDEGAVDRRRARLLRPARQFSATSSSSPSACRSRTSRSGSRAAAGRGPIGGCSSSATAGCRWAAGSGERAARHRRCASRSGRRARARSRGDHLPLHDRGRRRRTLRSRASARASRSAIPPRSAPTARQRRSRARSRRFEAAGFNELAINFSGESASEVMEQLEWFGARGHADPMKHGLAIFATDEGVDPAELARLAEERGFESLLFPEHTHIPAARDVRRAARRRAAARVPAHLRPVRRADGGGRGDERAACSAPAICLIVERDPIATAKTAATLDALSGGRFLFGVGAGWNVEEMRNHGTDPRRRFWLMRERVEAMKGSGPRTRRPTTGGSSSSSASGRGPSRAAAASAGARSAATGRR